MRGYLTRILVSKREQLVSKGGALAALEPIS
jgi:hypothetical protein